MRVYKKGYRVLSSDVDSFRRLRLSRLFTFLQELSIAHTTELGMGREKTLDKGLLWIVTMAQVKVCALPVYDQEITLLSWPGDTMHLYFPRYYRIEDTQGQPLIEGSALWALMDARSRRIVFPEEYGIDILGEKTGLELGLPPSPRPVKEGTAAAFTVPYSYVDINGHMSNTRYFDLMEDLMPPALRQRMPERILVQFSAEAPLGEQMALEYRAEENSFCLQGQGKKKLFCLNISYQQEEKSHGGQC